MILTSLLLTYPKMVMLSGHLKQMFCLKKENLIEYSVDHELVCFLRLLEMSNNFGGTQGFLYNRSLPETLLSSRQAALFLNKYM